MNAIIQGNPKFIIIRYTYGEGVDLINRFAFILKIYEYLHERFLFKWL